MPSLCSGYECCGDSTLDGSVTTNFKITPQKKTQQPFYDIFCQVLKLFNCFPEFLRYRHESNQTRNTKIAEKNDESAGETAYLDDGGNELFQEVVSQQRRPVMVDEVDEQALNVGAILILVQL